MQAFTGTDKIAFKRACKAAIECAAKDAVRGSVAGVNVQRVGDSLVLISTDRYRAMRVTISGTWYDDEEVGDFSMTVTRDVFEDMARQMTAAKIKASGPTYRLDLDPERNMMSADLGAGTLAFDDCVIRDEFAPVAKLMGDDLDNLPTDPCVGVAFNPAYLIGLARLVPPGKNHPLTIRFVKRASAVASTWNDGENTRCEHLLCLVSTPELREENEAARTPDEGTIAAA